VWVAALIAARSWGGVVGGLMKVVGHVVALCVWPDLVVWLASWPAVL
jgi:hypothetical protein